MDLMNTLFNNVLSNSRSSIEKMIPVTNQLDLCQCRNQRSETTSAQYYLWIPDKLPYMKISLS